MRSLLVFVLFSAMLCWFMFTPFYKHVFIVRHAVLQKEVDYLLEIGANGDHGYISAAMLEQSRERLAALGMRPEEIRYELDTTSGVSATNPASPVLRGTGMQLTIRYPFENLMQIDSLIGLTPAPADTLMSATGMKMSEYVP